MMVSSRVRCLVLACGLAAVGVVSGPAGAADILLQDDFETDPRGRWGNANQTGLNSWTTDDSFSPTHSLRVHTQHWYTPVIPTQAGEFYTVGFKGKTTGRGMWGPLDDPFSVYDNSGQWATNTKVFRNNPGIDWTQIVFFPTQQQAPVYFDDVVVKHVTRAEAAAAQDAFFATMPSFTFTPPAERHTNLTRTMGKLRAGDDVKVVMLGDSIVNDTSRGYFEPLIERQYPGSRVDVVTSVRGSTGMWWYKEENRVQSYVLDHEPDVVMIGGISHQNDVASVREVIRQIRAARPETEFILMSELAADNNPYLKPELLEAVDPTVPGWRSEMYCLAVEMGTEFLDMTQPWAQYIIDSGKPYDYFMRDALHLNARGSQVAGRIVESYFVINPEPGTMSLLAIGTVGLLRRRRGR